MHPFRWLNGWFQRWLVKCSETSGDKSWWLVCALGYGTLIVWVAAILPFIGAITGWDSVGHFVQLPKWETGICLYNTWTLERVAANSYCIGVFLSLPFAKLMLLIGELGMNLASGMKFYLPNKYFPLGRWKK